MAKNLNKDAVYKTAKPKEKDYTINDGECLVLLVKATGSKLWRFIYRINGKQNRLSFGSYPETTLESARRKAEDARQQLADGIDPSELRKQHKEKVKQDILNQERTKIGLPALNSFCHVAELWLKSIEHQTKPQTRIKKISRLKNYAYPTVGNRPINEIKSAEIYMLIKPLIEEAKLETAHRLHNEISSVFSYAIVHSFTDYDPAQPVGKQIPAQRVKHRAAIIDPKQVGQLLRDIENYNGTFVVQQALKLSPLLFQRPGETRQMLWTDIDFEANEWRPFISKTDFHHIVPLSIQAIELLRKLHTLTSHQQFVFPSVRANGKPMSDGTINSALKKLGYASDVMTPHGFRTTASTLLNEQGWTPDAIERQLAHAPRDHVRAAYNRAQYLEERRKMMQAWADYLDKLKAGAEVLPFKNQAG
ncbi:MAG: DUF4102 domain-containing protein [Gammaproteobacteria bacterium]|nr:DUF4102 domain-containing protein [Gammaproteobacteria bacterium]